MFKAEKDLRQYTLCSFSKTNPGRTNKHGGEQTDDLILQ